MDVWEAGNYVNDITPFVMSYLQSQLDTDVEVNMNGELFLNVKLQKLML